MKKIFYYNRIINVKIDLMFIIVLILLFFIVNFSNADEVNQNNQLIIDSPMEVNEENNFYISVYTLKNNTPFYQIDVKIIFDNKIYNITYDEPEIIIKAPNVNENTYYTINAEKNGYLSDETYIMIINNQDKNKSNLIITLLDNDFIVEGNSYFTILVTDEKGIPISNTTVGIQNYISEDSIFYTDENGRAKIFAPNNKNEIILLAQKSGYVNATEKIWININPSIIEKIINNPYTIIIITFFIVLIAIFIVSLRKDKTQIRDSKKKLIQSDIRKMKDRPDKTLNKDNIEKPKNEKQITESKIEEIRINKKMPNNKILISKNKTIGNNNHFNQNITKKDKWFEGIDDIGYKIDRLTENITNDEWFKGKNDIRNIIDEKLKKNKRI